MSNLPEEKCLQFYIEPIGGSFTFTHSPDILEKIQQQIDTLIYFRKRKMQEENLFIQKQNNVYHINLNAFSSISYIIFRVLRDNM